MIAPPDARSVGKAETWARLTVSVIWSILFGLSQFVNNFLLAVVGSFFELLHMMRQIPNDTLEKIHRNNLAVWNRDNPPTTHETTDQPVP